MEFHKGGNTGDASLVCESVFFQHEFNGGDGEDVVSSVCWGGAEETADFANGIILGDLKVLEYRLGKAVGLNWGAKGEYREDYGVVHFVPVMVLSLGLYRSISGSSTAFGMVCLFLVAILGLMSYFEAVEA